MIIMYLKLQLQPNVIEIIFKYLIFWYTDYSIVQMNIDGTYDFVLYM